MKVLVLRGADRWQLYLVAAAICSNSSVRAYTRPGSMMNPLDALSHSIFRLNIWVNSTAFHFYAWGTEPQSLSAMSKSPHGSAGVTDPQI